MRLATSHCVLGLREHAAGKWPLCAGLLGCVDCNLLLRPGLRVSMRQAFAFVLLQGFVEGRRVVQAQIRRQPGAQTASRRTLPPGVP